MSETQATNLTPEQRTIVAKLRYMARQYTNGSYARGGSLNGKHYLDEAADAIEELAQQASAPVGEVKPVEPMTRFCPNCGSVGPVDYTKHRDCCPDGAHARLIPEKLAQQCRDLFYLALDGAGPPVTPPTPPAGWRMVPVEPTEEMESAWDDAHGDGAPFHAMYAAMLAAAPQPGDKA